MLLLSYEESCFICPIFPSRDLYSPFREIEVIIIDMQVDLENTDNPEEPYYGRTSAFLSSIKK